MARFIIMAAASLITGTAAAQEMPGEKMICLTDAPGAHSYEDRDLVADHLISVFGKLDDAIPTLSPAEETWLKTEYDDELAGNDGKHTNRSVEAAFSTEMSKKRAKTSTKNLLGALVGIRDYRYDVGLEVQQWSRVAYYMIDLTYGQAVQKLQAEKIITEDAMPRPVELYNENMVLFGQCIVSEVIANIRP